MQIALVQPFKKGSYKWGSNCSCSLGEFGLVLGTSYLQSIMGLSYLICFLMIFPAYISSQITLTESGGGIKKPGETLHLICTVSGSSLTSLGVHWLRQAPGKGLEWAGAIWTGGGNNYNTALQNRIRITRDTSKHQVFLQLSSLNSEDTAIYYCVGETQYCNLS
uniref:Ig-like domain-containing protein n=1 Tax=Anolis carolinensis TaxID=28377 RepID=A0A803T856_ANOCA